MKKRTQLIIGFFLLLTMAACQSPVAEFPHAVSDVEPSVSFTPAPAPTPRREDYTEEELSILALADNATPRDQLVKTIYSQAKLHDLRYYLSNARRKLTELNKAFPIECLRQTEEGYYAVYLGEDGKTAFAFLEEDPLQTGQVLVLEPLVTKKEFLEFISEGVTRDEMLAADPNVIVYESPSGIIKATKHLVQEGAFEIDYLENGGVSQSNHGDISEVMMGWRFYSEEELLEKNRKVKEEPYVALRTPVILPIDKQPLAQGESGRLRQGPLRYRLKEDSLLVQQADNRTPSQELVTRTYSEEEIRKIIRQITGEPESPVFREGEDWIHYTQQLQESYPVECLRELPRRFYAVYPCENGKRLYVYLDKTVDYTCETGDAVQLTADSWSLYVSDCRLMGPFRAKQEFDDFLAKTPTLGEIQAFDPDGNTFSTNVQAITSHNVKEGVYVLTFNFRQGAADPSQWLLDLEKTKFYTNEEVETQRITPFAPHALLGIDKE